MASRTHFLPDAVLLKSVALAVLAGLFSSVFVSAEPRRSSREDERRGGVRPAAATEDPTKGRRVDSRSSQPPPRRPTRRRGQSRPLRHGSPNRFGVPTRRHGSSPNRRAARPAARVVSEPPRQAPAPAPRVLSESRPPIRVDRDVRPPSSPATPAKVAVEPKKNRASAGRCVPHVRCPQAAARGQTRDGRA